MHYRWIASDSEHHQSMMIASRVYREVMKQAIFIHEHRMPLIQKYLHIWEI